MKRFLLIAALLLAFVSVASAQESEFSGGGGTAAAITAGVGSGNAGRVPQFVSSTSLADSKMTTSGTNSGTWTLYDDTAMTGVTQSRVIHGAGQSTTPGFEEVDSLGNVFFQSRQGSLGLAVFRGGARFGYSSDTADWIFYAGASALWGPVNGEIGWRNGGDGNRDIGVARSAAGILKVTDGSTGSGGIGISDAATATVSDALILRHATSGTAAAGFGTGLLFQGEDAAGNMQDMASIQAVYTDSANGSEDVKFTFYSQKAGVLTEGLTIASNLGAGSVPGFSSPGAMYILADAGIGINTATVGIYMNPGGGNRWLFEADGNFFPQADGVYDIGTPSATVRNIYATGLAYLGASIQGARTTALTDNAAAKIFVTITDATSDTALGGEVQYVVEAIDAGTAMQVRSGTLRYSASNIGGTVTVSVVDDPDFAAHLSTGTLGVTFSATVTGTTVNLLVVADTSLDAGAETVQIKHRTYVNNGSGTVTPQT